MLPDPIFILGMPIYLFGAFAALSIFFGYKIAENEMVRLNIPIDHFTDLAFVTLVSAFFGARLLFVFLHSDFYAVSIPNIFKFWQGGIVLHGGLLGGLLGGFFFCWIKKFSFLELSDPVALGLSFGLALSRMGCLAAGCCYGKPTSLPWGICFKNPLSLATPHHTALHPTQAYSFLAGMIIFFILLWLRDKKTFKGELLWSYLLMASGARIFLEEPFRADTLPITVLFAFSIFILSAGQYFYHQNVNRRTPVKKSAWRLLTLILAVAVFAACGIIRTQKISRGFDIRPSVVYSIVKGTTTEKEILKTFGSPTKVRDTADGKEFFYEYTKSGAPQLNLIISVGGGSTTKTLLVWLDKQGVVTDYAYKAD